MQMFRVVFTEIILREKEVHHAIFQKNYAAFSKKYCINKSTK